MEYVNIYICNSQMLISLAITFMNLFQPSYDVRKPRMNLRNS
ncbi:hypothetical protein F383_13000 [Gossypium arboreum]|uniref:Uncharacterized protein n=1 Tax=Gossypium arboreum TaxID=29729 RepID=A0A0B0PML4_GOSAR|nr:hypothetical protein F383_13000 [Gossypium arboreum]